MFLGKHLDGADNNTVKRNAIPQNITMFYVSSKCLHSIHYFLPSRICYIFATLFLSVTLYLTNGGGTMCSRKPALSLVTD